MRAKGFADNKKMSIWAWLAIGVTALIGVPLVVALAVGRVLGQISKEVTELLETEEWSGAPLTRALEDPEAVPDSTTAPQLKNRSA
jgi:hypothetical protein